MTVAHDICFNYKRACVSVLQRFRSTGAANQQSFHIQSPGPRKPSRAYQQNKMFLKVPTYPQQKTRLHLQKLEVRYELYDLALLHSVRRAPTHTER